MFGSSLLIPCILKQEHGKNKNHPKPTHLKNSVRKLAVCVWKKEELKPDLATFSKNEINIGQQHKYKKK
jgi:hypothetical protein